MRKRLKNIIQETLLALRDADYLSQQGVKDVNAALNKALQMSYEQKMEALANIDINFEEGRDKTMEMMQDQNYQKDYGGVKR